MQKKRPAKKYWEMTTDELREATKEFNEEFVAGQATPLSAEVQSRWERAKNKRGRNTSATRPRGPADL